MSERVRDLEERAAAIFEPDTLLPSQFFDQLRRGGEHSGEQRLMITILEDAVNVYLKHADARGPYEQRLFAEAEEWIEDRDGSWIFSFESVCDFLSLEADYLRRGLRARKQRARLEKESPERVVSLAPETERLCKASGE